MTPTSHFLVFENLKALRKIRDALLAWKLMGPRDPTVTGENLFVITAIRRKSSSGGW